MLSNTTKSLFIVLFVAFSVLTLGSYVLLQPDMTITLHINYIYSPEHNISILNELGQIGVGVINPNNESFPIYLSIMTEHEVIENISIPLEAPEVYYYTGAHLTQLGAWTMKIHSLQGNEPTLSVMVVRNQTEADTIIHQRNVMRTIQWVTIISLIVVITMGIIWFLRKRRRSIWHETLPEM